MPPPKNGLEHLLSLAILDARESTMVDFAGAVGTLALIVFLKGALLVSMDLSRGAKLWLAGIVGLWAGVAAGVTAAGWMPIARPVPLVGVFGAGYSGGSPNRQRRRAATNAIGPRSLLPDLVNDMTGYGALQPK